MRHAGLLLLLPFAWLLATAATPGQNVSPAAAPPPTNVTPQPAPPPTPTPTPRTGYLSLDPTFGPPNGKVTVAGSQFVPGQQVQLYFDAPGNPLGTAAADGAGSFKVDLAIPGTAAVGPHTICSPQASTNAPCANFRVEPLPSPTPSESPSPAPSATPAPTFAPSPVPTDVAATPAADRLDTVAVLTRPPFVFFPILLLLAALGAAAWIWWGRQQPATAVRSAIVRHGSPTPRPSTLPVQPRPASPSPPAAAEPPPSAPAAGETPAPPPDQRATPGDESIDLPLPGE